MFNKVAYNVGLITEVAELAVLPFIYLLIYTKCSSA
jgi:hypothetical protein